MRLFATITLIAIASPSTIHRPTGIAKRTGVGIVFRAVFAVGKRCAVGGERRVIGYKCTVAGGSVLIRIARALTVTLLTVATVTTAPATAVATWATGAILLSAVGAHCVRVRVHDGGTVCAGCCDNVTRCAAVCIQPIGDLRRRFTGCVFCARLARWSCSARLARLTWRARRARWSRRLRINIVNATVLGIGRGNGAGFAGRDHLLVWRTRLTRWARWTRLIRVTWSSRLSRLIRLPWACGSRLSTLTGRTLLALGFGKRGIHIAVYVPQFVIVVTAVAGAISRIVHFIHL